RRVAGARRDLRAPLPHAVRRRTRGPPAGDGAVVRAGVARIAWLVVVAALAQACTGPGYLLRAGWSEARLLLRRRPIAGLLVRPDLDPALRERLELTLAVREFAADTLGLRVGRSYSTYAEVDDDATVWVVSAAYRDRLEPYAWRYP